MKGFELFLTSRGEKQRYTSMNRAGTLTVRYDKGHEINKLFNDGWCTLHFNPKTNQILVKPAKSRGDIGAYKVSGYAGDTTCISGTSKLARKYGVLPERPRYYENEVVVDDDKVKCLLLTPMKDNPDYWPNRRGVDDMQEVKQPTTRVKRK